MYQLPALSNIDPCLDYLTGGHTSPYWTGIFHLNSNHRLRITTPSGKQLSRLEMRAARILALGILPFCLINFPAALLGAAFHFTRVVWGLEEINRWLSLIMLVFRELILFHLIYIPVILMAVQHGKSNSEAEVEHYRMNRRSPRRRVYRLREMPITNIERRL